MGGSVEIVTLPGYLPMKNDHEMMDLFKRNATELVGGRKS